MNFFSSLLTITTLIILVSTDTRYNEALKHLKDVEGFRTIGEHPTLKSGVFIGIGIDLGKQTKSSLLTKGIHSSIISKVEKYLGYKSKIHLEYAGLKASDLVLTTEEAENISKPFFTKSYYDALPYTANMNDKAASVLVSLRYWTGSLNCNDCQLSVLVNQINTNYLWLAIKEKNADRSAMYASLLRTIIYIPSTSLTYKRFYQEIIYLN
ncbi:Phage-related lysozyme (muraminidase) [Brachionus plicatilis]|uniref:Phage-related lysozyme (Muraminidase) n=1 Tax=Brachionus plicatilis TaxID=10195 RepID=A0A3M7PBA5_BRAPC|nr:Phage-related lysozyme (muraminidase) [Brachionus plicatilis]